MYFVGVLVAFIGWIIYSVIENKNDKGSYSLYTNDVAFALVLSWLSWFTIAVIICMEINIFVEGNNKKIF